MKIATILTAAAVCLTSITSTEAAESRAALNLLQNSDFEFHVFDTHRNGGRVGYSSQNVAFWNTDSWGDVKVVREAHVAPEIRPKFSTGNLVAIKPGKKIWQFFTLPEARLAHGEAISLSVFGHQAAAGDLVARISLMKLDSEDGSWSPADFGYSDKRTFPRHSRGELVVAKAYEARSEKPGPVEVKIEDAEILGRFQFGRESHSADINTIGIRVEFENRSMANDVWVWAPCLTSGQQARSRLPEARPMAPIYRHLPRTIQKLWKGEPIHIVTMGSSIDRGSANPRMVAYDEDPASPTFKHPLAEREFNGQLVGREDLDSYVGWWQHYFSYTGRLKLELMRKFNLTPDKVLLNYMACDGSSVGEAHSGLADYCSLAIAPSSSENGHPQGKSWQDLYPGLFARPEGSRPDLIIFGSGANEKTDTPDEVAVFEGTIRWLQRHYPQTEFLFCQWQNRGGYSSSPGDMQALALRYQIPMMDMGKIGDDLTRWCNPHTFCPADGHPQAAAHYVWFKQLEKAFECWDPIATGQAQLHLPERLHANTYGWEGDMVSRSENSDRLNNRSRFILDDTAVNFWMAADAKNSPVFVDGKEVGSAKNSPARNVRNSSFRFGAGRLGDRHVLEVVGDKVRVTGFDSKVCPNRRWLGIGNPRWERGGAGLSDFQSDWGAPFGSRQILLKPGQSLTIEALGTDFSIAWVDRADGGVLEVFVDEHPRMTQPTNLPFVDRGGDEHYVENRKGITGLPWGHHAIRLEARDQPVTILGVFTYDSRSNRGNERRIVGYAVPGETVTFSAPFKARPFVRCDGGLKVKISDLRKDRVTFGGDASGSWEILGE
jgi:hypothetical protein